MLKVYLFIFVQKSIVRTLRKLNDIYYCIIDMLILNQYNKCVNIIIVKTREHMDRVQDSRTECLGLNSQHWSCVEVSSKLRIPHVS